MNKFEIANQKLKDVTPQLGSSVLDVGCRDCIFEEFVPDGWAYSGLDLFQNEKNSVTYVQSVEERIPEPDRAFSCVVALDVVEHVDRMSQVMNELWRVTDKKLIVALPNMAFAIYRWQFFLKGTLGEKYRLSSHGHDDGDRHRWVTTADESVRYMREFVSSMNGQATLSFEPTAESGKRRAFAKIMRAIGVSENFYAPTLVFTIERASKH